jgi:hypothetical protein
MKMPRTQIFLANNQRHLIIDFGLSIISLEKVIFGQIVEAVGDVGMILPESLLMYSERYCN